MQQFYGLPKLFSWPFIRYGTGHYLSLARASTMTVSYERKPELMLRICKFLQLQHAKHKNNQKKPRLRAKKINELQKRLSKTTNNGSSNIQFFCILDCFKSKLLLTLRNIHVLFYSFFSVVFLSILLSFSIYFVGFFLFFLSIFFCFKLLLLLLITTFMIYYLLFVNDLKRLLCCFFVSFIPLCHYLLCDKLFSGFG